MRNKIEKKTKPKAETVIRVRLNHRTTVTLKNMDAFKAWLERYPEAKIL